MLALAERRSQRQRRRLSIGRRCAALVGEQAPAVPAAELPERSFAAAAAAVGVVIAAVVEFVAAAAVAAVAVVVAAAAAAAVVVGVAGQSVRQSLEDQGDERLDSLQLAGHATAAE